jgi:hypothetical protein
MLKYTGFSESEVDAQFYEANNYSALMYLNILKYLYNDSEFFAEAIGYLKDSDPGFFNKSAEGYEIAQKYGYLQPAVNNAGIIYTPSPYLLCVFTRDVSYAQEVIGEFNDLLCGYTVKYGNKAPEPEPPPPNAFPTASTVFFNGAVSRFNAYFIDGANYFKLRDLAYVISGTEKQFEISYDNAIKTIAITSGLPYTPVGGEMDLSGAFERTAVPNRNINIMIDGITFKPAVYLINGNNYFKLRDLMKAIDIYVGYDNATKDITLDTSRVYFD